MKKKHLVQFPILDVRCFGLSTIHYFGHSQIFEEKKFEKFLEIFLKKLKKKLKKNFFEKNNSLFCMYVVLDLV